MKKRSSSREYLFQFLFSRPYASKGEWKDDLKIFRESLERKNIDNQFIESTIQGIIDHEEELYQEFLPLAKRKGITKVNKIILLLATYELKYTDSPYKVVINEALNLAHKFSTIESVPFINSVLDKIADK